jgi:choline dehydrogenase-like flavoprotein
MIADARTAGLPDRIEADLVIVGAGAAGITLALALADTRLQVILVEAGGPRYSAAAQAFYAGEAVDHAAHSPVDMYRRRVLGGSTTLWGGRCIPFDPVDLEERPWMELARWPFGHDEIAAHIPQAMAILEAGAPEFGAREALGGQVPMVEGVIDEDVILDRIERFSQPTDFGKRYREQLKRAPNIRLFTNAPIMQIRLGEDGTAAGVVFDAGGRAITIAATRVVMAAGGIETPRLLLSGNPARPQGLGNEHDLVGRFYQCHLEGEVGHLQFLVPPERVRLDYERSRDGIYCRRYIWLSPEAQRRHRLAGLVVRPAHPGIVDPDHRDPVLSAMYLVKAFIVPEYARKMTALEHQARSARGGSAFGWHAAHVRNIVFGSPRLAAFAADWARRRILASRKLPSVVLANPRGLYPADVNGEQEPNLESRITLGTERDALGMRRVRVSWCATEGDYRRLLAGLQRIAKTFAKSDTVRLDLDGVDASSLASMIVPIGGHHVGTARMAEDPRHGVCDANGEVFSVPGLFVAGAAVFPTSSFANPTLTLVALTLRLAEHLKHSPPPLQVASTPISAGAAYA